MVNTPASDELNWLQKAGLLVFVFLCGLPALEMNGFGIGIPISLQTGVTLATLGGLVGGALVCSKPLYAGIIGGLLAGPAGLLAVYFYTQNRVEVWNVELVLVQGIASLPGFLIGKYLKGLGTPNRNAAIPVDSDESEPQ
ncbi:MAG: hypothetical protein U0996_10010 [Planctomycetaceae bacterium]